MKHNDNERIMRQSILTKCSAFLKEYLKQSRGVEPVLCLLHPEEIMAIAVDETLRSHGQTIVKVGKAIGRGIALTYDVRCLKINEPRLYKVVDSGFTPNASGIHMSKALTTIAHNFGYKLSQDEAKMTRVGVLLINMIQKCTGLIQRGVKRSRNKLIPIVEYTDKAWTCLEMINDTINKPVAAVLRNKPDDWLTVTTGGDCRYTAIKVNEIDHLELLEVNKPTALLNVLNKLQAVPWNINKDMVEVCNTLLERDGQLIGYPNMELEPLPDVFWENDEEYKKLKEEKSPKLKEWKRNRLSIYEERVRNNSKRFSLMKTLHLAKTLEDCGNFWNLHTADWRGRIYPTEALLSAQGDDLSSALLMLNGNGSEAPVSDEYRIYLANLMGYDKKSYNDRLASVKDDTINMLKKIGAQPVHYYEHPIITEADSPLKLLAHCIALHKGYYNRLPVFIDGSCNGLQHLSALALDKAGAKNVNLVPGSDCTPPEDVYSMVANRTLERLREEGEEICSFWVEHMSRTLVKRNVMTTPYGATQYGYALQLETDSVSKCGIPRMPQTYYVVLAKHVSSAIGELLHGASGVMLWLQNIAVAASKLNKPVIWETPLGFVGYQRYMKTKAKKVDVITTNGRQQYTLRLRVPKLNKSRQKLAIAPNVIHSLDSTHLQMIARDFKKELAVVHDSFGCRQEYMKELTTLVCSTFDELYSNDILRDMYEQFKSNISEDIPEPPPLGELVLNTKACRYAFI